MVGAGRWRRALGGRGGEHHGARGTEGALPAVGDLEVEARGRAVACRHLEAQRRDRLQEAAQLLGPGRASPGLLEAEAQLAVAQHPDGPQVDPLGLHLGRRLVASQLALERRRSRGVDRPIGHGDAHVDAPVGGAPAPHEQVVVGARVDPHEPGAARGARVGVDGRGHRARPRPGVLHPRRERVRVRRDDGAHGGTRREHEGPHHDLHERPHGSDPTASRRRFGSASMSARTPSDVVADDELADLAVVHQEDAPRGELGEPLHEPDEPGRLLEHEDVERHARPSRGASPRRA